MFLPLRQHFFFLLNLPFEITADLLLRVKHRGEVLDSSTGELFFGQALRLQLLKLREKPELFLFGNLQLAYLPFKPLLECHDLALSFTSLLRILLCELLKFGAVFFLECVETCVPAQISFSFFSSHFASVLGELGRAEFLRFQLFYPVFEFSHEHSQPAVLHIDPSFLQE